MAAGEVHAVLRSLSPSISGILFSIFFVGCPAPIVISFLVGVGPPACGLLSWLRVLAVQRQSQFQSCGGAGGPGFRRAR